MLIYWRQIAIAAIAIWLIIHMAKSLYRAYNTHLRDKATRQMERSMFLRYSIDSDYERLAHERLLQTQQLEAQLSKALQEVELLKSKSEWYRSKSASTTQSDIDILITKLLEDSDNGA